MSDVLPLSLGEIAARIVLALACGAVIGLNRDFHRKPAGVRTFGLVGVGSAIVVLMMLQTEGNNADSMSRVIQGVLTGIGFLGAGVILRRDSHPRIAGLTTAAAIWLTASIGMAAGAGYYNIVWLTLVVAMVLLITGRSFERLIERVLRRGERASDSPKEKPPGSP